MTWWLWLIALLIGAALFVLGMVAAKVWHRRTGGFDHADRINAALGIGFTVVALVVAADTVSLQVKFNQQVRENTRINTSQTDCDRQVLHALAVRSTERVKVDNAAQRVDIAVEDAIDEYLDGKPVNWEGLRQALADAGTARSAATQVYLENTMPTCADSP